MSKVLEKKPLDFDRSPALTQPLIQAPGFTLFAAHVGNPVLDRWLEKCFDFVAREQARAINMKISVLEFLVTRFPSQSTRTISAQTVSRR